MLLQNRAIARIKETELDTRPADIHADQIIWEVRHLCLLQLFTAHCHDEEGDEFVDDTFRATAVLIPGVFRKIALRH